MARYTKNEAVTVPQLNTELEKIELAINDTLSRKGDAPNIMEAPLDMNSNRIMNLPEPVSTLEPVRKADFDSFTAEARTDIDTSIDDAEAATLAATTAAGAANTAANNTVAVIAEAEQAIDDLNSSITNTGWFSVAGSFTAGGTITAYNEVLFDTATGSYYSWGGALPKVVPASSTVAGTGGEGVTAWTNRGDAALRSELTLGTADVGGETSAQVSIASNELRQGKNLLSPFLCGLTPHYKSSLVKLSDTQYRTYLHLGGQTWQVCDFSNSGLDSEGNTTPFGWNQTVIQDFKEYQLYEDAGVTTSGSWGLLTSGDPNYLIGYAAGNGLTVGSYIEFSFDVTEDGANIELIFVGRTNGNIVSVTIDGTTDLVNEATEVDTYTAADLQGKQRALVATNLPKKDTPYVVRFTILADKNPSSNPAENRFLPNAIELSGANFGRPWRNAVRPKPWAPNTAVSLREERIGLNGVIYRYSVAGTTGTTIPSHSSGAAADGTAEATYVGNTSSFATKSQRIQATGSQLEYAYEFRPSPSDPYQDIGGNLHGNEYLTDLRFYVDGIQRESRIGEYLVGNSIWMVQNIYAYYGSLPTETQIADTVLTHHIGDGKIVISHESEFLVNGNFGYHYPVMWPLLFYSVGIGDFRYVFEQMETKQVGRLNCIDYAGDSNPIVGNKPDFQMFAYGDIYRATSSGGVPSTGAGEYAAVASLTITDQSVNDFEFGTVKAGMATNTANRTEATGFSSWPIKMYFARSNTDKTEPVTTGKVIRSDAEYKVALFKK